MPRIHRHLPLALPILVALAAALGLGAATTVAATTTPAPRIINGTKAGAAEFETTLRPTVALLTMNSPNQFEAQFCAGTLIDELHVLTAGHCIVEDDDLRTRMAPSSIGVLAGRATLSDTVMDRASIVPVSSIFVNPNFNIVTMRWDAAVLRLATPITNVPTMARLTDAEVASLGMGTQRVDGIVAGWGDTDPTDDDCCFPESLMRADVPIHADSTCETNLASNDDLSFSTEFQFCAGRLSSGGRLGSDTCQGDSGGPLIIDVGGTPRLAGVTSFGFGCGQRYFGVYARLTALAPWLESIPGIPVGDTRDPSHGPDDLAAPTVAGSPNGYRAVNLQITPASIGGAATSYTIWAREGRATSAKDIYLGRTTDLSFRLATPATNTTTPYTLLVRPVAEHGEGPAGVVRTRPLVDTTRPTVPRGLSVARSGATALVRWRASVDRQSGTWGYWVQRSVSGRWGAKQLVRGTSLRLRVGSGHGRVRVMSEDWADNRSAWSAAVAY